MPLITSLPVAGQAINPTGTVTCQVSAGTVTIKLEKKQGNSWSEISSGTYGVSQGLSDTLQTTINTTNWRISVTGTNTLSSMNLTIP